MLDLNIPEELLYFIDPVQNPEWGTEKLYVTDEWCAPITESKLVGTLVEVTKPELIDGRLWWTTKGEGYHRRVAGARANHAPTGYQRTCIPMIGISDMGTPILGTTDRKFWAGTPILHEARWINGVAVTSFKDYAYFLHPAPWAQECWASFDDDQETRQAKHALAKEYHRQRSIKYALLVEAHLRGELENLERDDRDWLPEPRWGAWVTADVMIPTGQGPVQMTTQSKQALAALKEAFGDATLDCGEYVRSSVKFQIPGLQNVHMSEVDHAFQLARREMYNRYERYQPGHMRIEPFIVGFSPESKVYPQVVSTGSSAVFTKAKESDDWKPLGGVGVVSITAGEASAKAKLDAKRKEFDQFHANLIGLAEEVGWCEEFDDVVERLGLDGRHTDDADDELPEILYDVTVTVHFNMRVGEKLVDSSCDVLVQVLSRDPDTVTPDRDQVVAALEAAFPDYQPDLETYTVADWGEAL